jgi:hypothetical protein
VKAGGSALLKILIFSNNRRKVAEAWFAASSPPASVHVIIRWLTGTTSLNIYGTHKLACSYSLNHEVADLASIIYLISERLSDVLLHSLG